MRPLNYLTSCLIKLIQWFRLDICKGSGFPEQNAFHLLENLTRSEIKIVV